MNKENIRLAEDKAKKKSWKKWGPYLSERQWGTVREDYSFNGDAWNYLTYEKAISQAYRWGEDGIGGISDEKQLLNFAFSFWNGKDAFLKERLFGLSGTEGNHGEDVKELYYYLDNLPTHSYMKMLYKYPQKEFPYTQLRENNRNRDRKSPEFDIIDTGIFDRNEYFDLFLEYAKDDEEDICIKITAFNRGVHPSQLNIIPQLWCRNTWDWGYSDEKPEIKQRDEKFLEITHERLGAYFLYFEGDPQSLFTDNISNLERLYDFKSQQGYYKDAFHDYIVLGKEDKVNPLKTGTKVALNYYVFLFPDKPFTCRLRLTNKKKKSPFQDFDKIFKLRKNESDEFYKEIQSGIKSNDEKLVQRQAFAGMLWSKQFYYFNVGKWLNGDPGQPVPPETRLKGRNFEWNHLNNDDIISMPDKWEYPWYAVWDLAFHCIPLAMIDTEFAKEQIMIFTRERYQHPNGQLPAYEWNFSDVNPPVHAWAAWRVYKIDEKHNGKGDLDFLEKIFLKLLLNFTWWVNKKDAEGRNIFQGGFLGMDNIGIFDRSSVLPTGGHLDQADGTSWMAMYSLNMLRISLELSLHKPFYQEMCSKFLAHFLYIAAAMTKIGEDGVGLWDEDDQFYYDALHLQSGHSIKLKVRSMVGLVPLFAVEVLDPEILKHVPEFEKDLKWFLKNKPELSKLVSRWTEPGLGERRLLSLLRGSRMKKLLKRMLDESEFLSEYGIRSLSKYHEFSPYVLEAEGNRFEVRYVPGESDSGMFGGNSNWRGPIWFPVNYLIIESLQKFHHYYGDDFKIEYPADSGNYLTINDVANKLSGRLKKVFLKDNLGRRPIYGKNVKFQSDPYFKDMILFYEYFNGDNGQGLGASHQTGWTGLIAKLIQPRKD